MKDKIYFVDCFDTIVYRKFSPNDVIFLWAEKIAKAYPVEPKELFKLFKRAERHLSQFNLIVNGDREYTLDEIFCYIDSALRKNGVCLNLEFAKNLYYQTEQDNLLANVKLFQFLKERKQAGCKIYLVSNFYVKGSDLQLWLEKVGVASIFDDIFVSCDFGCSKNTTLYSMLLSKLGLSPEQVTMIGDNHLADGKRARKNGLDTVHVWPKTPKSKLTKNIESPLRVPKEIAEIYDCEKGYSNYAFPLYAAIKWLDEYTAHFNIKNLFFLSREGQFLKKLFDKYLEFNKRDIKTHYLGISRNTIFLASAKKLNEQDFGIFSTYKTSLRNIMMSLQFSDEEIETVIKTCTGLDFDEKKKGIVNTKAFEYLKTNEEFKKLFEEKRRELSCFNDYLKSFGVDMEKEGLNVVDVGWQGTMQNYLKNYFAEAGGGIDVRGFYLGLRNSIKPQKDNKYPLLFIFRKPNLCQNQNTVYKFRCFDYEQILRADHNRISGYKKVDNRKFILSYEEKVNDKNLYQKYIFELQNNILSKFTKLCEFDKEKDCPIYSICQFLFCKMMRDAGKKDYNIIKNCFENHYDAFGTAGYLVKHYQNYVIYRLVNFFYYSDSLRHFNKRKLIWL